MIDRDRIQNSGCSLIDRAGQSYCTLYTKLRRPPTDLFLILFLILFRACLRRPADVDLAAIAISPRLRSRHGCLVKTNVSPRPMSGAAERPMHPHRSPDRLHHRGSNAAREVNAVDGRRAASVRVDHGRTDGASVWRMIASDVIPLSSREDCARTMKIRRGRCESRVNFAEVGDHDFVNSFLSAVVSSALNSPRHGPESSVVELRLSAPALPRNSWTPVVIAGLSPCSACPD